MPIAQRLGVTADDGDPIFLVDGSAYIYRGFYAYPDMARSDGMATNAIFIVLRLMLKLLREEKPGHLLFVLDGREKNFRSDIYPEYKANRSATPEPLVAQLEPLKEGLERLGIPVIVSEGAEADDCIASLAKRLAPEHPVIIMGPDKDLNQCLAKNVWIWDPAAKKEKLLDGAGFREQFAMEPEHFPDYQALIGDSADNIPGIPGVGPKTAQKLMAEYPTLEALRDHADELDAKGSPVSAKIAAKVREHIEDVFTYRELTRLKTDQCAELSLAAMAVQRPDPQSLVEFMREYEFRSLGAEASRYVSELAKRDDAVEVPAPMQAAVQQNDSEHGDNGPAGQLSLFGAPATAESAAEEPPIEDLPEVADVAALTKALGELTDATVAVVDNHVAAGDTEVVYTGDLTALATACARAAEVVVDDYKALVGEETSGDAWRTLDPARITDLSLGAYLLHPEERNYAFERVVHGLYQGEDVPADADLPNAQTHPARAALVAAQLMRPQLASAQLGELMATLELPLIPVLVDMERAGIAIDEAAFTQFLDEVQGRLDGLTERIHTMAGHEFNIRSSAQLGTVLFEKLGLKPKGKTPGGQPSTSATALEKLKGDHEIVEAVLEYRMLEKLRSTYLEPLPGYAQKTPDGRIHTTFNHLATATGRLSSSQPNMQNIPIRGVLGPRMRGCFVAAPGNAIVSADYSQVELRLLAAFSEDAELIRAFRNNEDIHARTASLVLDKDINDVTGPERSSAKAINFGLLYGMGPQKLGQEIGVSLKEAKAFIERYFEKLTGIKRFYDDVLAHAEEYGYVTTIAGRRRLLPDIHSRNNQLASLAKRQAINTRVQGSAADLIKLAMLRAHADDELRATGARMILQVHDELLLEVPAEGADAAAARLQHLMSTVYELAVPLVVDTGAGPSWKEAH